MTRTKLFYPFLLIFSFFTASNLQAQCDCTYPVIFIHGWTGNAGSFDPVYSDTDIQNMWGGLSDTFDAVLDATPQTNIKGADDTFGTPDDDVLYQFINDDNVLASGCLYAIDFDWYWNENPSNPEKIADSGTGTPSNSEQSDSNESAVKKQGYALGKAIERVLAANPTKKKVIIMGHSMGGLCAREYLQRNEGSSNIWWVNPSEADGHKVAQVITLGTPHRGSNTGGNILDDPHGGNGGSRDGVQDLFSEAVRDLRYSYACGFLNLSDCVAPYLFGGDETANVDSGWFRNGDVNCDGDEDQNDIIVGINEDGIVAGFSDEWDGTHDNPAMPLPTNVRYSYYVSNQIGGILSTCAYQNYGCGGDGVVDDQRQWIYEGGQGRTQDFYDGVSVPMPSDGVDNRLSNRVTSENRTFHTSQTGDLDYVLRLLDEGDYPEFAHDVNEDVWYAGMPQIRADIVPTDSEYTNSADEYVDGDWFKVEFPSNVYEIMVELTPNDDMAGRLDLFEVAPTAYDNSNAPTYSLTWNAGQTTTLNLATGVTFFMPGTYYFRITHDVNTTTGSAESAWRKPYKFRVSTKSKCIANLHINGTVTPATYDVSNVITSDGLVDGAAVVNYFAGDCVELQPGFEVMLGGEFLGDIQGCILPLAPTTNQSRLDSDTENTTSSR